ncbi:nucleoside hydrolase [Salipiger bermudensis]|uniref:nucleoside hydrolase n=1 Tax=Salipiger bermudensis TaxID=344736 RepID=UPI001CD67E65|nr:nucleoside hydrolase [Salipiger bermudensis]MCA0961993.1 nucleoside hydrolase [Salipiger bermudensis]
MTVTRIIIDTDPGVDDAAAIWLALASPEIELLGVTAVAGNVPLEATYANACRIVGLSGRADVPVMAGARGPLLRDQVFGKYAAIGAFPEALVPDSGMISSDENAVAFIARTARGAAREGRPVTICAIGPLTNVAMALRLHPEVAQGIERIVVMGGAFRALGHRTPWAEFNVYADPHAAQIVLGSGVPITMCPLDVTLQALFTATHVEKLREQGGAPGCALARLVTEFDRSDPEKYGRPGGPLHDPMTIAWLVAPELFSGRRAAVGVQVGGSTSGHTYADFNDSQARTTVMTDVNEPGYIALVVDRIAALGAASERTAQEETRQ